MSNPAVDRTKPSGEHSRAFGYVAANSLYIVMLLLALFGVAYTSIARQSMIRYWIALAPVFAVICLMTRWRELKEGEARWTIIRTELLHWGAVLLTMLLSFVANVQQMMNSDASALMVLAILALGTFSAGVHLGSWRLCAVGAVLGVGVPIIAWFEQTTALLLFLAAAGAALVAFSAFRHRAPQRDV